MTTATKSQYQACIDRAQRMGGTAHVTELGGGAYRVLGSRGDAYTVRVDVEGEYSCTCPAGRHDRPCWHQASTWIKRISQLAFGITPAAVCESDATVRARLLAESRARTRHITELEGSLADCFTTAA